MSRFSDLIHRQRRRLGLGRARLGALVGRSASTVSRWERGELVPEDERVLEALANVFEIDPNEMKAMAAESRGTGGDEVGAGTTDVDEAVRRQPDAEEEFDLMPSPDDTDTHEIDFHADEAGGADPSEVGLGAAFMADIGLVARPQGNGDGDGSGEVAVSPDVGVSPEPAAVTRPAAEERFADPIEPEPNGNGAPVTAPSLAMGPPPQPDVVQPVRAGSVAVASAAAPRTVGVDLAPNRARPIWIPSSYLDDPRERLRYSIRAYVTAAILIALAVAWIWAGGELWQAISDAWHSLSPPE